MAWWKLSLVFIAGVLAGALAWGFGDLAILDFRGERDLEADDLPTTELFDDSPVRETEFSKMTSRLKTPRSTAR